MKEILKCKNEDELLEILISNFDKLTCFNCGKKLVDEITFLGDDIPLGTLYYEKGELNYPREPDIPPTIYFECMECDAERDRRIADFIKSDEIEEVMDFVDEIMDLFSFPLEKATKDMKEYELEKRAYKKKLIKLFELVDRL